jgi:hypothetical protein
MIHIIQNQAISALVFAKNVYIVMKIQMCIVKIVINAFQFTSRIIVCQKVAMTIDIILENILILALIQSVNWILIMKQRKIIGFVAIVKHVIQEILIFVIIANHVSCINNIARFVH